MLFFDRNFILISFTFFDTHAIIILYIQIRGGIFVKDKLKPNFYEIYKIILSIVIFFTGVLLITGCLHIYYSGNGYSSDIVAAVFSKFGIYVYVCLGLIVVNFLLDFFLGTDKKIHIQKDHNNTLKLLLTTRDTTDLSSEFSVYKERKKLIKTINYIIVILSGIVFLVYAGNPDNFHTQNINQSIIDAMFVLLPCSAVALISAMTTYFLNSKFTKKQIDILKTLPKKSDDTSTESKCSNVLLFVKIGITLISIGLIVFGSLNGGFVDVLTKAVNICTECIGLG